MKHGASAYANSQCRCKICRAANTARKLAWSEMKNPADAPHGTLGGYRNWGCRCDACRAVHAIHMREYMRAYRARKKASA